MLATSFFFPLPPRPSTLSGFTPVRSHREYHNWENELQFSQVPVVSEQPECKFMNCLQQTKFTIL